MSRLADISGFHIRTKRTFWGSVQVARGAAVLAVGLFVAVVFAVYTTWWMIFLAVLPGLWGWNEIAAGCGLIGQRFSDAPGTATLGKMRDLREHRLLEQGHERIYCGAFKGKNVYYGEDRHVLTVGPTRFGKDTTLLIPNLLGLNRSVVVIDPKAEAAAITARFRARLGPVIVINPFGVLAASHPHLKSGGFNPLRGFDIRGDEAFAHAMSLGDAMVKVGEEREKHWARRAQALMTALIMKAKWDKGEKATMRDVTDMLTAPYTSPDPKAITFQKIAMAIGNHADEQMAKLGRGFISGDESAREIKDVISTTMGQTSFLNDGRLMTDMGKHPTVDGKPFDFEMLKERVITVYVILPADKLSTHAVWLRVVVASALNALKRSGPGRVRPVLMLNEAGNLGYLEPLQSGMGIAAGLGVTIWTVWQSLAQIRKSYGSDGFEEFLSGAAVVNAFRAADQETARYLSSRTGHRTEVVTSFSLSHGSKPAGRSDAPAGFPLLRPEDFMALKRGEQVSWVEPSSKAYRLSAPGYWDIPAIAKRADPNPYHRAANG